jgi:voltage-gated potassium channel Kch
MIYGLTRATGSNHADALRIAAVLGQGGEFGFVLLTVGRTSGLWARETETLIAAVITVTMAMTPFAVKLAERLLAGDTTEEMEEIETVETADESPVIIAGFGRFGQVIARILRLRGYELTLIDNDPRRIQIARTFGNKVFFGDLRRGDILRTAGAERAKAIFLCGDDAEANARAIEMLRERLPYTLIFARAGDRFDELKLEALGADGVIRETFESSIELAREALERLGDGDRADDVIEEFRRRDTELLRLQSEYGAEGAYERMRQKFSLEEER